MVITKGKSMMANILTPRVAENVEFQRVSTNFVSKGLSKLEVTTASGPDGITASRCLTSRVLDLVVLYLEVLQPGDLQRRGLITRALTSRCFTSRGLTSRSLTSRGRTSKRSYRG